jgi:hypothetical protein
MKQDRAPARTFPDLVVWRKAHEFVLAIYKYTAGFPKQETYGLSIQMRCGAMKVRPGSWLLTPDF